MRTQTSGVFSLLDDCLWSLLCQDDVARVGIRVDHAHLQPTGSWGWEASACIFRFALTDEQHYTEGARPRNKVVTRKEGNQQQSLWRCIQ